MRRILVSLLACLALASSCAGERPTLDDGAAREVPSGDAVVTTTEAPVERAVVRLAVPTSWSLDPAEAGPGSLVNRVIAGLLYEGLTSVDDDGVAQPAIALRWFVSDDRLTWTFVLDEDFVDGAGEPLTARDAKQSLERVAARGSADQAASALISISGWVEFMSGSAGGVSGISAPDETTLVIQLDRPDELLLEALASPAYGLTGETEAGLRTTGAFRSSDDPARFSAVDDTGSVAAIELVSDLDGPAAAIRKGDADWAVLDPAGTSTGLDADIIRQPLDLQVALVARHRTAGERLGVMSAISPLLLANSLDGLTARSVAAVTGEYDVPAEVTIDLPIGDLGSLGVAVALQLMSAGIDVETVASAPADFAVRISSGEATLFPVVVAGGTGPLGAVLRLASPGAIDDVFGPTSDARTQLAVAVRSEVDVEQRALFAKALERALIEDGLLLPLGRFEVRVALGHRLDGLRHRSDGTLDLSAIELAES